ncbi:protein phosphatase 2C family protein [Actinidia rufa]|uniref:Protein phosphatase 2C family protein n=1 Tax=Actinidia rufa TaxID=165716 RepID=A0A7J0DBP7_9ERIC|nr:protein phosphatase 2C family protein [Actinidia rufa]
MGGCVSTSYQSSCYNRKGNRKTFSDHVTTLQHLSTVPNRILANGKSRTSCIFTQQGRKGINQDAMIVWDDFMSEDGTFCGVFDGHVVLVLVASPGIIKPIEESPQEGAEEEKAGSLWREAFLKSYKAMDKELKSHPNLDCFCSGSTAVTIVKQGSNLYMGSIGDSRAILGSKDSNETMVAIQLTIDLKPDLPSMFYRYMSGKLRGLNGVKEGSLRWKMNPRCREFWLPFDDAPGLAMARAFGDFCLKEYGVISIPEFSHRTLTESDKFIVLASDGVWDVLSNEEVVEIVSSALTRSSAARLVVESAAREWKSKYLTSKMDDCAVVCLFLDGKMDSEPDYDEQGFSSATFRSNNGVESDDGHNSEPSLQRNFTCQII